MERKTEEGIIIEGKNEEEALQAACDRLNSTPNQVEYEVLESGKGGVLGLFKGKSVRIRVWEKSAAQRLITEIVKQLFEKMGIDVDYRITQAEDAYEVDLQTSDADGLLIGRGGDTLKALQHLVSRMVGQRDENIRVRVDVAGYRKRSHEQLRRKALDLAERALSGGRDALSELLPADERRIVHLTLAENDKVTTRAIGDGQVKRVAVCPV
ncbi:MAG: Jag N-terminal domain-containing protein, partial [Candidatus Eisenbacteria sp.]|nr:Jag N-terminal domain-containing protein [Candidatus Eisenbacteria bacterium]